MHRMCRLKLGTREMGACHSNPLFLHLLQHGNHPIGQVKAPSLSQLETLPSGSRDLYILPTRFRMVGPGSTSSFAGVDSGMRYEVVSAEVSDRGEDVGTEVEGMVGEADIHAITAVAIIPLPIVSVEDKEVIPCTSTRIPPCSIQLRKTPATLYTDLPKVTTVLDLFNAMEVQMLCLRDMIHSRQEPFFLLLLVVRYARPVVRMSTIQIIALSMTGNLNLM